MYSEVCVVLFNFLLLSVSGCMPGDDENTATARLLASHQQCNVDEDCKENSFCFGNDNGVKGYCKCREPYFTNKNRTYYECLLGAGLGEECLRDVQCLLQSGSASFCSSSNVCRCKDDAHVATDKKCYTSKKLGEICLTRNECRLNDGTFAYCDLGHCICPPSYHPATDLLHCIPSIELGQSCESDENCYHTNAHCEDVCKCSPDYAESRDGTECLLVAQNFGEPCLEDVQCARHLKESICNSDFVCSCRQDYHEYNASEGAGCYRNVSVGGACDVKAECVLSSVMEYSVDCINGICTCVASSSSNEYGCEIVSSGLRVFSSFCLVLMAVVIDFFVRNDIRLSV